MANQWFKFYGGEYLSDPKMAALTPQERSCWLTLLCLASMATTAGEIGFLTVEVLLSKSGIVFDPYNPEEWNNNLGILKKFEKMKMLDLTEDGSVILKNWEKRQEHNLTVAERVAKHRLNKKNVTTDVTSVTTEENRIEKNTSEAELRVETFSSKEEDAPTRPSKEKKAGYEMLLQWAEKESGRKFVHRPKQYAALKQAQAAGLKAQDLRDRWEEMENDKFWSEKGYDWTQVVASFNRKGV
tara:strand:+ start:513 stop:1235 length:723 start_codon:yes stop_codon:yes gene_type:complete